MSILTYFHPVKQKPHFPDPSSPLKEKFPPATIALEQQTGAKVVEATDQRINIEQTAKNSRGTWQTVTSPLGFCSITTTANVSIVLRDQTSFLAQGIIACGRLYCKR